MSEHALIRLKRKLAIILIDAKKRNDQTLRYDIEECIALAEIITKGSSS